MTWVVDFMPQFWQTHLSQGHFSPHKEIAQPHYIHVHMGLWGLPSCGLEMISLKGHMFSEVGDLLVPISQARNSKQRQKMFLEHWE